MASGLKASETLAVKAKATELSAAGRTIYDLSSGEPDIDTPEHIKEACIKALKDGHTKYKPVQGIPELRTALSEKFEEENGLAYSPAEIIITNGAKQALFNFFMVTLNIGDEVVIPAPYWVSFPSMVEIAGGRPVIVNCSAENVFKISPEQLERSITPKTKAFILNSPSNPTGAGYSRDELLALAAVLEKHPQVLIVSDEIYEKVIFGDYQFYSFAKVAPQLKSRILTVGAFSKTYSMTGLRVGYAAGAKEIIAAMSNLMGQSTSNVNSICQYGAIAALKGPQDFITVMNASFQRRIDSAIQNLEKAPGIRVPVKPNGAFFLFVDYSGSEKYGSMDSTTVVTQILEKSGVACVQGIAFGNDRALRISVSVTDEMVARGTAGIAEALST
jgi:aspartate aminotransferase